MMTVSELIEFLKTQPQDLPVAYQCCSEQVLLETTDQITIESCCEPRADGWVHDARPDKKAVQYLMFPGN
jgi:hypothetical protein